MTLHSISNEDEDSTPTCVYMRDEVQKTIQTSKQKKLSSYLNSLMRFHLVCVFFLYIYVDLWATNPTENHSEVSWVDWRQCHYQVSNRLTVIWPEIEELSICSFALIVFLLVFVKIYVEKAKENRG